MRDSGGGGDAICERCRRWTAKRIVKGGGNSKEPITSGGESLSAPG